jgi:hypothetical protein
LEEDSNLFLECGAEMDWTPATIEEVKNLVKAELRDCTPEQIEVFREYAVEPRFADIVRHGRSEIVVVVAQKSNEVIYWEDVEESFNLSLLGLDGRVLEHWCNQDALGVALSRLVQPREERDGNYGPARPPGPLE